jgi:hypothetical protein
MDDEKVKRIKICLKNEPNKVVCLLKDISKGISVKELRELVVKKNKMSNEDSFFDGNDSI